MHRDPNLRKRNALAISGTLLILASLAGILYAELLRGDFVTCEDGSQIVFAGACRSAALVLLLPLAVGALLLGLTGLVRPKSTCLAGHGTVATTTLSVLVALTFLPLLAGAYLMATEDADAPYVITYNEVDFSLVRLTATVGLVGLVALLPFLTLYLARSRPRKCCRDRKCFEPCFCDESVPGAPRDNAYVTTAPWPQSGSPAASPAPSVPASPPPSAAPVPVAHDPWPLPLSQSEAPAAPMAPPATRSKAKAPGKKSASTRRIQRKKTA